MRDLIHHLMTTPPGPVAMESVDAWWSVHQDLVARFGSTLDLAVAGGFAADRLGWAFASGYQAALGALLPGGSVARPMALCATEENGAHPRDIATTLRQPAGGGLRLDGSKCFVTLGARAELMVVIASKGLTPLGRNQLRAVLVDAGRPGISVEDQAALPYVPEVPHGVVTFSGVPVGAEDILPGDGYDAYLKPFRTLEDLHVTAATFGTMIQILRRVDAAPEQVELILTGLAAVRSLAGEDPLSPEVHLALGGLESLRASILEQFEENLHRLDEAGRARWFRDRPLLTIAARARQRRLEAARRRVAQPGE